MDDRPPVLHDLTRSVVHGIHLLPLTVYLLAQGTGFLLQRQDLGISLEQLGLEGVDGRMLQGLELHQLDLVEKAKFHVRLLPLQSSTNPVETIVVESD